MNEDPEAARLENLERCAEAARESLKTVQDARRQVQSVVSVNAPIYIANDYLHEAERFKADFPDNPKGQVHVDAAKSLIEDVGNVNRS